MARDSSSQKFIGKNNAPRVQIEYDVEVYGSQKKVELPFVTGVMADLSGHRAKPLPAVEDRKFLTFDLDNFDARMRAINPRLQFNVENSLSDDDLLNVELEFSSMNDFSPGAIASNIPQLNKLLETRSRLSELLTYMDGKASAEDVIKNLLENPDYLRQLSARERKPIFERKAETDPNDDYELEQQSGDE